MRRPPPVADLPKYPVTGGTLLCAIFVTVLYLSKAVDLKPLFESGEIRRGELWRIVTSTLPHANVFHLVFNLYWTWVFGSLVESTFGHFRTLVIFLLLAVAGNGAEYALLRGGIGLSGVGYGLFGLVWVLSRRDRRFIDAVDSSTIQLFVGWFFFCVISTALGWWAIANVAHGVGCATGALLGWTISGPRRERLVGTVSLVCGTLVILAGDTVARPWVNLSKYLGGDSAKYADVDESRFGYDALMAGRNQEAARWYEDAVRMNPGDAGAWYNLGIACGRLDRHDEELAAYEQASKLAPENAKFRDAMKTVR